MLLSQFNENGLLPPGVHWATWEEIVEQFGYNDHRKKLLGGLYKAIAIFKRVGCKEIYIDGSFCTSKIIPNDIDICYNEDHIDWNLLKQIEPVFLDFRNKRANQKAKYFCEFFPMSNIAQSPNVIFFDFFQQDRNRGDKKGILGLKI